MIGPLIVETDGRLEETEEVIGRLLRVGFGREENGYSGNASRPCEDAGDSARKELPGRIGFRLGDAWFIPAPFRPNKARQLHDIDRYLRRAAAADRAGWRRKTVGGETTSSETEGGKPPMTAERVREAIAWLAAKGLIYDSGKRRNGAIVWCVTPGKEKERETFLQGEDEEEDE